MNIFASYPSPSKSAEYLDDKRVIKMILESTQLLSTAMHELGIPGAPYKRTHVNHPCSIWVRESKANFKWLLAHLTELCNQYSMRYGKIHKCEQYLPLFIEVSLKDDRLPEGWQTPFPNCTTHKDMDDVHEAYRQYLLDKWETDKIPARMTIPVMPWLSNVKKAKMDSESSH